MEDLASDSSLAPSMVGSGAGAASLKARSGGRRRSCNRCSKKKERCDGQEPCERCARSGLECLYASCRTLGRPRSGTAPPNRRSKSPSARADNISAGDAGSGFQARQAALSPASAAADRPKAQPKKAKPRAKPIAKPKEKPKAKARQKGPSARAAAAGNKNVLTVSMKRASLSPSPATGLTGLVQNKYITCFVDDFACFFRVLDDVTIRLGLINLMTGKVDPTQLVEASSADDEPRPPKKKRPAAGAPAGASPPRRQGGSSRQTLQVTAAALEAAAVEEDQKQVVNAINSSVFSAMSLGAMLLGQPPSHVHLYVAVAEASLRLCGIVETAATAVPNEHVAAAALLLAFAANVSGKAEYKLHMRLARQCYETRMRHGLLTPPPIRESLGYRAIIDALCKPPDSRGLRISSPSREARLPALRPECTRSDGNNGSSSSSSSSSASGGGSCMASPGAGNEPESQLQRCCPTGGGGGTVDGGAGGAGGSAGPPDASRRIEDGGGSAERRLPPPSGLEAARERRRLRRGDPMAMICDILTVLSRVPWTAHVEEAARRTKRDLCELQSLMIAEKSLVEERRFVSGPNTRRTESIAVFVLASAFVGMHCALGDHGELLRSGREIASCLESCPGLARYQPHTYHAGLTILAAFDKRSEFEALLVAVPRELRVSLTSGRPLTYEAHSDTCSHPACRKHADAIAEMGREMRAEGGEKAAPTLLGAEEDEDEDEEEEEDGRERGGRSLSGKVMIRAAPDPATPGEDEPVPPESGSVTASAASRSASASTMTGGKTAALIFRSPSPPDVPGPPSSPADALSVPQPEPVAAPAKAAKSSGAGATDQGGQQPEQMSFAHLQGIGSGDLFTAQAMAASAAGSGSAPAKRVARGGGGGDCAGGGNSITRPPAHQGLVSAPATAGGAVGVGAGASGGQGLQHGSGLMTTMPVDIPLERYATVPAMAAQQPRQHLARSETGGSAAAVAAGGVQAMQVEEPAAGMLTSRLWGVPALRPTPPPSGGHSAPGGAGIMPPTPHIGDPGFFRPFPWHPMAVNSAQPAGPTSPMPSNLPGSSGLEALRTAAANAPRLVARGRPGGAPVAPPPPSWRQGRGQATAGAGLPAQVTGARSAMTAGEASAAAISRANPSSASSASPFGSGAGGASAIISVEGQGAGAEPGSAPGVCGGGAGESQVDSGGRGEVGLGGAQDEELLDLWYSIGRGDSE